MHTNVCTVQKMHVESHLPGQKGFRMDRGGKNNEGIIPHYAMTSMPVLVLVYLCVGVSISERE